MCDCTKKTGFGQSLSLASAKTKETGEQHVVFYLEAVKQFFVAKESDIYDDTGVCCYFKPDGSKTGEKIEYAKRDVNTPTVQAAEPAAAEEPAAKVAKPRKPKAEPAAAESDDKPAEEKE